MVSITPTPRQTLMHQCCLQVQNTMRHIGLPSMLPRLAIWYITLVSNLSFKNAYIHLIAELDRGGHFVALDNTAGLVRDLREIANYWEWLTLECHTETGCSVGFVVEHDKSTWKAINDFNIRRCTGSVGTCINTVTHNRLVKATWIHVFCTSYSTIGFVVETW